MASAPSVTDVPTGTAVTSCPVCPHALADHDRISLRFCQATQVQLSAGAGTHGCVCPS
ncbi:RGCVC family protein [Blastococcus saxobsidens]|uniref:Uncharacterized protein n=1 Tax=Blastococcus saxobsidens TaxID=138336 RepID=A0A4Q7Y717_9ACTN|nr:RGCVC family protein [Blastococcus saxobsidens]RZU32817.1 hypothetical protein BKA19_2526 [Blastococcus saxobsidens]